MASIPDQPVGAGIAPGGKPTFVQFVDQWIYVFMAALFVVTALVGFIPTSIEKVMAVRLGFRPPMPFVLHVHAVLMGAWLLLLLTQTALMATGRRTAHMQLGIAGMFLAPAMLATGFWLIPVIHAEAWPMIATAPPEALPMGAEGTRTFLSNLVATQIAAGTQFAILITWALLVRVRDSGMHKRLIILATVCPLPAAIDRITWLPQSHPESPTIQLLWPLLWIMPMFLWDQWRLKRIHRAYVVWAAVYVPLAAAVSYLWMNPAWIAFAQRLTGVA